MLHALIAAALVAAFGRRPGDGFGKPGFVAPATPDAPVEVTGASFVLVGTQYLDANTGREISAAEAARRAKEEGQTLPRPSKQATWSESPPILVSGFEEPS